MNNQEIIIRVANSGDTHYSETITREMEESAKARGTGIAKRSPEYVANKMNEGKSVIAHTKDGTWVGFCYIETWSHEKFVANSGLIVSPEYRQFGLAKKIKQAIFSVWYSKSPLLSSTFHHFLQNKNAALFRPFGCCKKQIWG